MIRRLPSDIMSNRRPSSLDLKIVVLGPAGVGKSCLIHRFCNGDFLASTMPTIGAGFFPHMMTIDGAEVNMTLWDTAGEERFKSVAPSLLRGANALVLVFDASQGATFKGIDIYLNMFVDTVEYDENSHLPVLVLGNKCDVDNREIDEETVERWKKEHNVKFSAFVSAKTGYGVEEAFTEFIGDFLQVPVIMAPPMAIEIKRPEDPEPADKTGGCC